MIYLYGLLSLYDLISTWFCMTIFGVGDANPIANIIFTYDGGWAFVLAVKILEVLGIFAIAKLWGKHYSMKPVNYIMAVLAGVMLGVALWNTYAFVMLLNI